MHIINYMQERPSHSYTLYGLLGYIYTPVIHRPMRYTYSRSRYTHLQIGILRNAASNEIVDVHFRTASSLLYCILLFLLDIVSTLIKSLFTWLISSKLTSPLREL